nr:hypothetical protein [Tanacetum cinerariifolium]
AIVGVVVVMTAAAVAIVVWQCGDGYGGGVRATRKGGGGDRRGDGSSDVGVTTGEEWRGSEVGEMMMLVLTWWRGWRRVGVGGSVVTMAG